MKIDFNDEMENEKMNDIEQNRIIHIDKILGNSVLYEITENEKDTLAFIRNNVINEIESKSKQKNNVFSLSNFLKVAAIFVIFLGSAFIYQSLDKNHILFVSDNDNIMSDTKELLINFTSFNENAPKMLIEINKEKAVDILKDIDKLKSTNISNKKVSQLISDMERILLAISSLDSEDVTLQVKLIQNGIKKKKVIKQLNDIKI